MIFDLISLLGAIGDYWEIRYLTLALIVDHDASEDDMLLVTGTSCEGHVWRRFLIRPKYLQYVVRDWGQGEGLKRLFARYPVLGGRSALSMVDADWPETPAMQRVFHSSHMGADHEVLLHESGKI